MPDGYFTVERASVDIAVVVVTYQSGSTIGSLIDSLRDAVGDLRVALIVVDNASNDDTVPSVAAHPDVILVETGRNGGYAAGVNAGLRTAPKAKMALILNPDLEVSSMLLVDLLSRIKGDSTTGVVFPLLVDDAGRTSPSLRREPSFTRTLGDALLGKRWRGRPSWLGEVVYDEGWYNQGRPIDWATGAAVGISSACLEDVGLWDDENFFLYSEETDFCRRVREAGWRVETVPTARAHHTGGGSGVSPVLDGVLSLSRVRYMEKHQGKYVVIGTWIALIIGHLLRIYRPGGLERLRIVSRPGQYWLVVQERLGGALPTAYDRLEK